MYVFICSMVTVNKITDSMSFAAILSNDYDNFVIIISLKCVLMLEYHGTLKDNWQRKSGKRKIAKEKVERKIFLLP